MIDSKTIILIIDDKPANIFATEHLLERPDRTFLTATEGKHGLKLALENPIDLIILDVQMPGMDGFEVASILKSNKRTKEIPIIFASAEKKERHSIMKGFEEGAVDYLSKPLDPEVTKAKVSVLLKIQMQKRELIEKNASLEKADRQINQLNADLKMNLDRLEMVNKELESFSYSVSHDLRAPLRTLGTNATILIEDYEGKQLDEEGLRVLNRIRQNVANMNNLIDDLLNFSKMGRQEVRKVEVDIIQMVHDIIAGMQNGGTPVQFKVASLPSAMADRALLTQVWVNLISNAFKYSGKKENPKIEIGSFRDGAETVYFVRDNGAGFNMDYAEKLFGVFQRLHKSADFEGTGVGLAIVKRIIAKHGGRVWAEGKVNEGAIFYFSLPAVTEHKQIATVAEKQDI